MIDAEARTAWQDLRARLRPFVARRVASEDVDDVLQDVFLRLQRGLAGLQDERRFGPWVYRVARSAVAEHWRQRARHPLADGSVSDETPSPEEREGDGAGHALAGHLASFVAALPDPYREALILTELEGLTQQDAARQLGISLSGMKSRVQRGRLRLREALERTCTIALDARRRVVQCEPRRTAPCSGTCACAGAQASTMPA